MEAANRTHSQSYMEDLQALSGQKRYTNMARLNLSVLPMLFVKYCKG
nr:secretion protein HlyD [Selenomonas infelix]